MYQVQEGGCDLISVYQVQEGGCDLISVYQVQEGGCALISVYQVQEGGCDLISVYQGTKSRKVDVNLFLCIKDIDFSSFPSVFWIAFWNCSDSVVHFSLLFCFLIPQNSCYHMRMRVSCSSEDGGNLRIRRKTFKFQKSKQ